MIIGLAGKKRSGKSLVGRFLCVQYDAVYAPFATTLKGAALHIVGLTSFKPSWDIEARQVLQRIGTDVGRFYNPCLWIDAWKAAFDRYSNVVIPDVRFENEVGFIRFQRKGIVLYFKSAFDDNDPHPSEQLSPDLCDATVEITDPYRERRRLFELTIKELERLNCPPTPRKPRIYVGFNIHTSVTFRAVADMLTEAIENANMEALISADVADQTVYTSLLTEKPLPEVARHIVAGDLKLINEADGGLFYLTEPSIGAAFEILALSLQEKPVAIVTPLALVHHIWLQAFGNLFWNDVGAALQWLKSMLTL